jgi:hypothetical protein
MRTIKLLVTVAVVSTVILLNARSSRAQTSPGVTSVTVMPDGKRIVNKATVFKDEKGKELTFEQMRMLMATGDYKIVPMTDKDKKPYNLVKSAPGFAPKPMSQPVVIKP